MYNEIGHYFLVLSIFVALTYNKRPAAVTLFFFLFKIFFLLFFFFDWSFMRRSITFAFVLKKKPTSRLSTPQSKTPTSKSPTMMSGGIKPGFGLIGFLRPALEHKLSSRLSSKPLLIAHPHLLVRGTNERFLLARSTFRVGLASESH